MSPSRPKHSASERRQRKRGAAPPASRVIPRDEDTVEFRAGGRTVTLANLRKPFWPRLGLTKRALLQCYLNVAAVLLPHLRDRAMVMKRYPDGAGGKFFFIRRAPSPRPDWIETCTIAKRGGGAWRSTWRSSTGTSRAPSPSGGTVQLVQPGRR